MEDEVLCYLGENNYVAGYALMMFVLFCEMFHLNYEKSVCDFPNKRFLRKSHFL